MRVSCRLGRSSVPYIIGVLAEKGVLIARTIQKSKSVTVSPLKCRLFGNYPGVAFIIISLLLGHNSTLAQKGEDLNFQSIVNSDGLPHNFINCLAGDELGFLWIGTNDGLCRYDSPKSIKNYKKGDIGLESSTIRALAAGSDSSLWIGTRFGGLTHYDLITGRYKNYNSRQIPSQQLSQDEVLVIKEVDENEIWIGTEKGLNILDTQTESIYQFPTDSTNQSSPQTKAILEIFVDHKKRTWIGTWDGGLYLYLPSSDGIVGNGTFRRFRVSSHNSSENVWSIFQDSADRMWIGTHGGGLHLMNLPPMASNHPDKQDWTPTFHSFLTDPHDLSSISSDHIQDITEDHEGNLWIVSVHGLNIIEAEYGKELQSPYTEDQLDKVQFKRQYYDPSLRGSLCNTNLSTLYRDKQNLMWIGTISGLNMYNWYTNQFELFPISNSSIDAEIRYELINSLFLKNDSTLVLASDINGLMDYNTDKKQIVHNPIYGGRNLTARTTALMYDLPQNQLYIGHNEGISKVNYTTGSTQHYSILPFIDKNSSTIFISHILKDSKGRIWCGTESGLFLLNDVTGEYRVFNKDGIGNKSITDNSVTQVFEDSEQNIWVSTFNGLNLLSEINEEYSFIKYKNSNDHSYFPSNQITSLREYDKTLFLGTHGGFANYDLNKNEFSKSDTKDKTHSILSLEITNDGILWASTSDGILRQDINNNETKLYTREDGIGDMSFRINSSYLSKDDELYFGGIKGLIRIKETSLQKNNTPPEVYITDVETINSKDSKRFSAVGQKQLILAPNNFYVSIDFAALNYNQAQYNQYAYKLEGFGDEEWTYTNNQNAIYTNLSHGEYTFVVKGSNNEGIWNEQGTSIKITAKAKLVETLWFKILALLLGISLLYLLIRAYTKTINQRNQFLKVHNKKLNTQIELTQKTKQELLEREARMKSLVAELEESNTELSRSNKDLEQFAHAASHDMQEPLRTIGSFTSLFINKYDGLVDQNGRQYIKFIGEGVNRLSNLINSLLTYSQVGKNDGLFGEHDLNKIVERKISDLSKFIKERNAQINIDDLPKLVCVSDQIGMVFYNLILNGIKFNKTKRPTIDIRSSENDESWIFSVEDNGIGIPSEYKERIFGVFKRLHNKEEYEGSGIGLALCNRIVQLHNGEIWLESKLGKGTCFYFTISKNITDQKKMLSESITIQDPQEDKIEVLA